MKALLQRVWERLRHRLAGVWVPLLLLAGAAAMVGVSLNEAPWLDWTIRPAWVVWPGLLCGLLLAQTRWPGWFGGLYSIFMSLAAGLQVIGQPVPPAAQWGGLGWLDGLMLVNLRLHVLAQRLSGWLDLARSGLSNFDSGLPLLMLLLVGWNVCAWMAFHARRGRVFWGLVAGWVLLAFVGNAGGQNLWLLAYFTLVALVLLGLAHFRERIASWERRRVDYPDELSGDWMAAAATLGLAVMLLARAAPAVASPQGWQKINDWFKPTQNEQAATPAPVSNYQSQPLPARSIDLSVIGLYLPESNDTVLWVRTSDPLPAAQTGMPASAYEIPRHYWRGGVMSVYTGRGWQAAALVLSPKPAAQSLAPTYARRKPLEQTFELPGGSSGMLFAANEPLEASGADLYASVPDGSLIAAGQSSRYQVVSWVPDVDAAARSAADPQAAPPDIVKTYTQLPASLPQRVRDLSGLIAGSADTAYAKAVAIQNYLRLTYPYDLTVAPPPAGTDEVDNFLFEARAGFCSHFATAMAVLLRAQGVPARVAVGYLTGEYDPERGAFRVPASAAHAWVEVYFAGYGWIEFEPTPAFQAPGYELTAAGQAGAGQSQARKKGLPFDAGRLALIVGIGLAAGVLAATMVAVVRFERGARRAKSPAGRLYWRLRSGLAWAGQSAPATVTPLEFLEDCRPALAARPNLLRAVEELTGLYVRDRFAPGRVAERELAAARARWRAARGELGVWILGRRITTETRRTRRRKV
ncbi:transglutaminase-like enzyme, putative cysteine protease [Longilinea arvoryzae]|uniref:Transglutaminase-like enzyme, putative cysteine protease n=1 Tax=Longilinea arvoryzae TaxID=360412 RepID=A0A0K8MXV9_9CHLR|nr:transglutaminase domain-containing protein [Longilinea arvoryzae]GAP16045.1 transglutaminase-like enzyme, putative cysteine protease [Longilinea arvoryzae]